MRFLRNSLQLHMRRSVSGSSPADRQSPDTTSTARGATLRPNHSRTLYVCTVLPQLRVSQSLLSRPDIDVVLCVLCLAGEYATEACTF